MGRGGVVHECDGDVQFLVQCEVWRRVGWDRDGGCNVRGVGATEWDDKGIGIECSFHRRPTENKLSLCWRTSSELNNACLLSFTLRFAFTAESHPSLFNDRHVTKQQASTNDCRKVVQCFTWYIASIDKRLKASTTTNHVLVLLCAFPLYSRHLLPNEHAHPLDIVSCDPPHVGGPALRSMHTLSRFAMLAATNWSW